MWCLLFYVLAGLFVNVHAQATVEEAWRLGNASICGLQPPKTRKRLDCEDFHKENMNIGRCPYAFPVYVRGQLEDIYATDGVDTITVRTSLEIRWNATVEDHSHQPHNQSLVLNRCVSSQDDFDYSAKPKQHVWIPQLFVSSSRSSPKFQTSNEKNSLTDDGANGYSIRQTVSTKLWCQSSLRHYPIDTHVCTWYLGAFQAQNYSVQLFWDEGAFSVVNKHLPSGFDVTVSYRDQAIVRYVTLGYREVSRLSVVIKVTRRSAHAVILVFLPGLFMVIIAWISFYLPDELGEGRVLLSFLTLVGTVQLVRQLQSLPHSGVVRAIDVWMLSVLTFVWLSVVACFLDLRYAFRGLEREQQESVDDVLFFYQQPKLARQLADESHREERQRARAERRRGALTTESAPRRFSFARRRPTSLPPPEEPARGRRGFDMERIRRQSTWQGEDLFWDAETGESPAGERVEWSEFYQWAHVRHASRSRPLEEELDDDQASQWSVQSLLKSMWNIRKEYRWLTWSDYVKKCVEIMYPVFFCVFCVTFFLVFVHDSFHEDTTYPIAIEAKQNHFADL